MKTPDVLTHAITDAILSPSLSPMMSKVLRKFEEHLPSLQAAIAGDEDLRDNHKLYNKLYRFYKKDGVVFTGDNATDYNIVINYLYDDLYQ